MSTTTPDEPSDVEQIETVLTGGVHSGDSRLHLPADDGDGSLCGCTEPAPGWKERDLGTYPPSSRRWCKRCLHKQEAGRVYGGQIGTKPCPKCGQEIGQTVWPQHFVACDGGGDG